MAYSSLAEVSKLVGWRDGSADAGGILAQCIASANLIVKAKVKAAGLTPPTGADDTLNIAEQFHARANLRMRERMDGSLPGIQNPDTNDATNKAIKSDQDFANEKINEYIRYTQSNVEPYDTDGQARADATGTNFKLDQSSLGGFTS